MGLTAALYFAHLPFSETRHNWLGWLILVPSSRGLSVCIYGFRPPVFAYRCILGGLDRMGGGLTILASLIIRGVLGLPTFIVLFILSYCCPPFPNSARRIWGGGHNCAFLHLPVSCFLPNTLSSSKPVSDSPHRSSISKG